MKILITMYNINNPGGIINHNENLIAGFQKLGHRVNFVELLWREKVGARRVRSSEGFETKASGFPVHQGKGWLFPKENRIPYKGTENIKKWKEFANHFDIVIWQIPVPTKQKDNEGNTDWPELYNLNREVQQLAIIHDGNLQKSYPWIQHIQHHLTGLACVHPCAYNGAAITTIPRALILNPQRISVSSLLNSETLWENRTPGFISLQTFKAWKHVDDLVRSIPHMKQKTAKYLAGGGIEHNYMTSKDKCKSHYYVSSENDPCISGQYYGERIWDVAQKFGMQWLGYISESHARMLMRKVRCLIDPSWSKAYAKVGDHFNRVVVDGILEGAIPIARNLGISTNEEGIGEVFKPNQNYVMIPYNAQPREFADIVEGAVNLSPDEAAMYHENNAKLLQHFEHTHVANQYIALAQKQPAGFYKKREIGGSPAKLQEKSAKVLSEFFRIER